MEIAKVGAEVVKRPHTKGVKLLIVFKEPYDVLGSSLTEGERSALKDQHRKGDKITIDLERPRPGVILLTARDPDSDDMQIYNLHVIIFERDEEDSINVVEVPDGTKVTERWQDLQHLDNTIYIRVNKTWYVGEPTVGIISPRLNLKDYRLVDVTTLLRYVFDQVTKQALDSSYRRKQDQRSRRDQLIEFQKDNAWLMRYFELVRPIFGFIRDSWLFRFFPKRIKDSLIQERDFKIGEKEPDFQSDVPDVHKYLDHRDRNI